MYSWSQLVFCGLNKLRNYMHLILKRAVNIAYFLVNEGLFLLLPFLAIPCNLSNVTVKHTTVPREPKNRYRTGETFALGCQIGYKPVGNGTQECNEGNWTTQEFYCESEYVFIIEHKNQPLPPLDPIFRPCLAQFWRKIPGPRNSNVV